MNYLFLCLIIILLPLEGFASELDEVVDRIQRNYDGIVDFQADFYQSIFSKTMNQHINSEGSVSLKKSAMMRWEFKKPKKQLMTTDGKKIWIYTPELKQVMVGDASLVAKSGVQGVFLLGVGRLKDEFHIRFLNPLRYDESGYFVLDLTPRTHQPSFNRLILVVDPENYYILKASVYDAMGNTVNIHFINIKVNSGLKDSLFVFKTTSDATVVPFPVSGITP